MFINANIILYIVHSNFYDIVDPQGQILATLSLNDVENSTLIKTYGLQTIALSLALQRYLL